MIINLTRLDNALIQEVFKDKVDFVSKVPNKLESYYKIVRALIKDHKSPIVICDGRKSLAVLFQYVKDPNVRVFFLNPNFIPFSLPFDIETLYNGNLFFKYIKPVDSELNKSLFYFNECMRKLSTESSKLSVIMTNPKSVLSNSNIFVKKGLGNFLISSHQSLLFTRRGLIERESTVQDALMSIKNRV